MSPDMALLDGPYIASYLRPTVTMSLQTIIVTEL